MENQTKRYDVLIVGEDPAFDVTPKAARALVQHLGAITVVSTATAAEAKEWTCVYMTPGPTAHVPFVRGAYTSDPPPFLEAVLRFGQRPEPAPYGPDHPIRFFLEFRGCTSPEPLGPFRKRLHDLLVTRVEVHHREFTELPPHREVAEDEQPGEVDRPARKGGASVGTWVEEL